MAYHRRNKSRGPLSVFSFDTTRSSSRAAPRQASPFLNDGETAEEISEEAAMIDGATGAGDSSLSRLAHTGAHNRRQRSTSGRVPLTEADLVQSCQRAKSTTYACSSTKSSGRQTQGYRTRRPLSWIPPSSKSLGQTSHLGPDSVRQRAGGGIISDPILTSTTNAKVAQAEGIRWDDVAASGLAMSSQHRQPERLLDASDGNNSCDSHYHQIQERDGTVLLQQQQEKTKGRSKISRRASTRSASMNALSKVKGALTTQLRHVNDSQTYRSLFKRDKFVRLGDDCSPPPLEVNEKLERIRTEGRNLGRDKIRMLTGHGHVKRKPVQTAEHVTAADAAAEEKKRRSVGAAGVYRRGDEGIDEKEHTLNFSFEDLESSFAQAVDQLDRRTRQDEVSPTALSYSFAATRHIPFRDHTGAPQLPNQQSERLNYYPPPQSVPANPRRSPPLQFPCEESTGSQPDMGQCASSVFKCRTGRNKAAPEVYSFPYQVEHQQAEHQQVEQGDKDDRAARAERIFSRGHPNPLASHPDVEHFAHRPVSVTTQADTSACMGEAGTEKNHEEREFGSFEGATTYAPSFDNISEYGKNTPSSVQGSTHTPPHRIHNVGSRLSVIDTPTRASGHRAARLRSAEKQARRSFRIHPGETFLEASQHAEAFDHASDGMHAGDVGDEGNHQAARALRVKDPNVMKRSDSSQ